jgi:hypothetical protein
MSDEFSVCHNPQSNCIVHQVKQIVLRNSTKDALCGRMSNDASRLTIRKLTFHSKISTLSDFNVILFQFCLVIPRLDPDFVPEAGYGVVETPSDVLEIEVSFRN